MDPKQEGENQEEDPAGKESHFGFPVKVFPIKLPDANAPVADSFGLTMTEKMTMLNAWTLLHRGLHSLSLKIYVELFVAEEMLYERFRWRGKLNFRTANLHPKMVLQVYEKVFNLFDKPRPLRIMLKDMAVRHKRRGVTFSDWQLYTKAVLDQFLKLTEPQSSPTLVTAMKKLTALFNDVYG